LAHYKNLLDGAGLLTGLEKWSGQVIRQRASSPKWLVLNTGLMTALRDNSYHDWRSNPEQWGRLSESAIGAHLVNSSKGSAIKVHYWRDRNKEVDFILSKADRLIAIEVKSGILKGSHTGLKLFSEKYNNAKILLVGKNGIPIEEFLSRDAEYWFTK
jgi:predicted AAA+ superfamily ATPase